MGVLGHIHVTSKPTWLSNTDLHIPTHEVLLSESECLLETIKRSELDIAEAFWLVIKLVLHNAHVRDLAILEKIFNLV